MIYDLLYGAATANPTSHTSAAAAPPPTSSRAATAHPWRKRAALTPKAITTWPIRGTLHRIPKPRWQFWRAKNDRVNVEDHSKRLSNSLRGRILYKRKFIRFPSHEVVIQWTAPPNATVHITHVSQRRRRIGDPNNKIPKYRVQETIDSIWFQLADC